MTCPTLLGQLRARPWIPRLGTPTASSCPDLNTREQLSDLMLSSVTIARLLRVGKRWRCSTARSWPVFTTPPRTSGRNTASFKPALRVFSPTLPIVPDVPAEDASRSS